METFALVKFEECLTSCFIMPWLIGITLFHGRKDMDQPFGFTSFGDDLLDTVIFTESTEFADEFRGCSVYSKESCKNCFARFYCSGGCMANSYKFNHSINDTYEVSCEMERKRVECAIMIKAALADAAAQ